jgi:hypothetical protein
MPPSNPRRQQWRRLRDAAARASRSAIALVLAVIAAGAGQTVLAIAFALVAAALAVSSRHALRLAARSRVGAESEAQVRRALEPLRREGWQVQHALDWAGGGDLDHVVRAPSGVGFVIETKTLRYKRAHCAHTAAAARRLARRRRRYRRGVRPVICLTRARGVERIERGVLVVSLERLMAALRQALEPSARR